MNEETFEQKISKATNLLWEAEKLLVRENRNLKLDFEINITSYRPYENVIFKEQCKDSITD